MNQEKLRQDLQALHDQLNSAENLAPEQRDLLKRLAEDIQSLLSRYGTREEEYRGLRPRLREAIAQLEASHPSITLAMRQVIDSLSFLGI